MRLHYLLILFAGCCCNAYGQSQYSSRQVPKQIQYQGRVATGIGGAWNGTEGYFMFAIFQGATVLWNNWEGQATGVTDPDTVASPGIAQVQTLQVNNGVFSVRLGSDPLSRNLEIPAAVFFNTTSNPVRTGVKLKVWFSPDGSPPFTKLSPDVNFTSVPFAMVAGIAETVKQRAVTTEMLADGAVTSAKIASSVAIPPGMALVPAGAFMVETPCNRQRQFTGGRRVQCAY